MSNPSDGNNKKQKNRFSLYKMPHFSFMFSKIKLVKYNRTTLTLWLCKALRRELKIPKTSETPKWAGLPTLQQSHWQFHKSSFYLHRTKSAIHMLKPAVLMVHTMSVRLRLIYQQQGLQLPMIKPSLLVFRVEKSRICLDFKEPKETKSKMARTHVDNGFIYF